MKRFPYVVKYEDHFDVFDYMEDWCREHFGDKDGKCDWSKCELHFDKWYDDNNFDEILYQQKLEICGPRPDPNDREALKIYWEKTRKVNRDFFDKLDEREDMPQDHSHTGIWTTVFAGKTGYDYGFQNFYFKNEEDAVYFKIRWDG